MKGFDNFTPQGGHSGTCWVPCPFPWLLHVSGCYTVFARVIRSSKLVQDAVSQLVFNLHKFMYVSGSCIRFETTMLTKTKTGQHTIVIILSSLNHKFSLVDKPPFKTQVRLPLRLVLVLALGEWNIFSLTVWMEKLASDAPTLTIHIKILSYLYTFV